MVFGKNKFFLAIIIVLSAAITAPLFALDITVIGGVGNFSFNTDSETPLGPAGKSFKGSFYPLGKLNFQDQITESLGYTATIERDPVLRNILSCEMTMDAGAFSLSAGPLFSVHNPWTTPFRPGISAGMTLQFPGIIFINLWGGSTFGSAMENDYSLETGRIALGVWLPNLISTFSLSTKKFSESDSSSASFIQDELFRVSYRADIHEKNVPYTISIEMGYEKLTRSYFGVADDVIRGIFLGAEININVIPRLALVFGAEVPVYAWGKSPLEKGENSFFFQAFTGFRWTSDKADP